ILIENAVPQHLRSITAKMEEMGDKVIEENECERVIGPDKLKAVDIKTKPHPGFTTDKQSQMMALLLKPEGTSMIKADSYT
ncbi:UDP-N-acetylglucosamine 1-carboxyvinyltransferase, partial [Bacillus cereus group sp. N14]|nr:UDP-N-acetylglucosamine 1-carboxyvinyltransferase [Bacillus cereus group sp. N14]